jgi:hypothetical protein
MLFSRKRSFDELNLVPGGGNRTPTSEETGF